MPKEKAPQTNTEIITELMIFPRSGPLMQVFIITAIQNYAAHVAAQPPMENHMINGDAWKACAKEALTKLEEKYGPTR